MASVKLSSVIWRRFEEETDGVRWKGKFKTTKAEKDSVSMYFFLVIKRSVTLSLVDLYEYKEHIIYDDDENERLQSGSDRYDIKAIVGKVRQNLSCVYLVYNKNFITLFYAVRFSESWNCWSLESKCKSWRGYNTGRWATCWQEHSSATLLRLHLRVSTCPWLLHC